MLSGYLARRLQREVVRVIKRGRNKLSDWEDMFMALLWVIIAVPYHAGAILLVQIWTYGLDSSAILRVYELLAAKSTSGFSSEL
jgi:hypothetical protein